MLSWMCKQETHDRIRTRNHSWKAFLTPEYKEFNWLEDSFILEQNGREVIAELGIV